MRQTWNRRTSFSGIRKPRIRCKECGKCAKKTEGLFTNGFYTCKTESCARFGMSAGVAVDDRFY